MPARCKRTLIPAAAVALCAAAVPVFAHPAHLAADRQAAPQAIQAAPVRDISLEQAIAAARITARPATYRVQAGDTLTAIAGRYYQRPADWTVIYWANRIRWADEITTGQVLIVPAEPAEIPAAPGQLEPPAPAPVRVLAPALVAAYVHAPAQAQAAAVGAIGESAFEQCVIRAESGGNAQVMNSTGHYGLFQFSAQTWAEYGGNPADFGNASAAEQARVFDNAMATPGGADNWSPYDGCPA